LPAVLLSFVLTTGVKAQDETGLPGDNFSLEGALEMFKKAENPGDFEKMLNTKANGVNNLDLNHDGDIDYIRVINKKDGDVQLFVLQALVSSSESQDVAVIELEKTGDANAVVQIVGDEDIYGVARIVEPSNEEATAFNDEAYDAATMLQDRPHGPNAAIAPAGIVVNVWFWPVVRYVYAPYYTIWVSPWRWYHYPSWWDPWRPLAWDIYRPICYRYRPMYVVVHTHRVWRAPRIYRPIRVTSPSVYSRNRVVVNNYRTNYRNNPGRYDRGNSMGRRSSGQYDRSTTVRPRAERRTATARPGSSSTPRRAPQLQYDRGSSPATAPVTQPGRRANRPSSVDRSQRRYDRSSSPATAPQRTAPVTAPRREANRPSSVDRPQRQYNRRPSPATAPQRTAPVTQPRRDVNRSRSVDRPQRQYNRSSSPAAAPRREMNRSRSVSRPQPQRQFNRSSSQHAPQRSARPSRGGRERS
jgi:hypothetical protein